MTAIPQRYLQYGEPLYDRVEQTSVVLTDPALPRVKDLDPETRELVLNAEGNQKFSVGMNSKTVEVAFIDPDQPATKAYTYPVERLTEPDVTALTYGLTPTELARAYLLRDLAAETTHPAVAGLDTSELLELAEKAGVPDRVIDRAEDLPFKANE